MMVKAAPPPPPPPPAVDQVAVQPSASITCTVGQMSTRVDFANMQDSDRYGMQILQQAHLAAKCMRPPSYQAAYQSSSDAVSVFFSIFNCSRPEHSHAEHVE